MFYGILAADGIVILTDAEHGKPIIETEPMTSLMPGYTVKGTWVETDTEIIYVHNVVPVAGTAEEAAVALSRMQFMSLSDETAYDFRALAPEWIPSENYYGPDDSSGNPQSRVLYNGELYTCLKTHTSQTTWNPEDAPSLWSKILPGQSGSGTEVGEWVQPESTNGYSTGDRVIYNGHLWESIVDNNVDVPGTDNGFRWTDLGGV